MWSRGFALIAVVLIAGCRSEPAAPDAPQRPEPVGFQRAGTDALRHGQRITRVLGCVGCHGEALTGEKWVEEAGFGIIWTSNLTRVASRLNDADFATLVTTGRRADGSELWEMPSHLFTALSAADMAAVIAYLRSRPVAGEDHPRPTFQAGAREEMAAGIFKSAATHVREEGAAWPPDAGPRHALGRYIVRATCAECHRMDLTGGQPHPGAAARPDLRAVIAAYDQPQFRRLMRDGIAVGDRELPLMSGVARGRYRHFTDNEADAIYIYLRALPPPR